MAPPPPPPAAAAAAAAGLMAVNAKRYTLAALLVTLAVAAIVTGFFVLFCPAHITFSVTHSSSRSNMSSSSSGATAGGSGSSSLDLTLAADNPSRRATVEYESMFVDVSNSTAPGGQWDTWVRATVKTPMPLPQPGRNVSIDVTVPLVDGPWTQGFVGNLMTSRFSVMVTAQAKFRVGVARTRLYDIKVSCSPISFVPAKARPAGAPAGGGAAALPSPVTCA